MIKIAFSVAVVALVTGGAGCSEPGSASPRMDAEVGSDSAPATDASHPTDAPPPPSDALLMDAQASDMAADRIEGVIPEQVEVVVTLDGEAGADILVVQAGTERQWRTGPDGRVTVDVDTEIDGDVAFVASHPAARVRAVELWWDSDFPLEIHLTRFVTADNPDYEFQDPGEPTRRADTAQCGHCHETINDAWFDSPHRKTAKNPTVQDLYAGTAAAYADEAACTTAGGRWRDGIAPGTDDVTQRCYLGDGVLPTLNPDCQEGEICQDASAFGQCADCHAPGINGQLGGRDLRDATGFAYDYGVFCNVCHQVEGIDLDAEPGVAGRLRIIRPSESASFVLGAGGYLPLTFGPSHDSPNPRMGSVQRDHFQDATLCAGCHQQDQRVLVPGETIDRDRWPDGRLPIHSTFQEWKTGALSDATQCQACHMAPDPTVDNGADLQLFPLAQVGIQGGWHRPPGHVRKHNWVGPRTPESGMLQLAAGLFVQKSRDAAGQLTAAVTVKNAACGHGLPTGEPMRNMLLLVDATCDGRPLPPRGGDVVPDFGGALQRQSAAGDWTRWPTARVGDIVRVIRRGAGWHEYDGFGRFAVGAFRAEQKGMPLETYVGEAQIVGLEDGVATFDAPLPEGDFAYLARPSHPNPGLAGAPGFGFARVTVGADGQRMVPHFAAVDIASDNRLMPQQSWTSNHIFADDCAGTPQIHARLVYRAYPPALARARGWPMEDILMTEVTR